MNITTASLPGLVGCSSLTLLVMFLIAPAPSFAAVEDAARALELLRQQNERLQLQMEKQQELIDRLGKQVSELERKQGRSPEKTDDAGSESRSGASAGAVATRALGKVHISGEGGLALFRHEAKGKFPNAEMRVDEAKLFVETPVWKDVYFFTELNFTTRESANETVGIGEIYVDFENLSRWWKRDGQLSLRVGRFDVPFGEEYLTRDAIDNPLISHSLADFWGVDEGVEAYGVLGRIQYILSVQNGGKPGLRDYNKDKAVVLRLGCDPAEWLHLGLSAMRTGDLDVKGDKLSELWFGNTFIRSIGSTNTITFGAEVFQGDAKFRWRGGHLGLAGGYLRYSDDDTAAENRREIYFYSVEAVHHLTQKLYGAARFSEIIAHNGYPLTGDGTMKVTDQLWRLSMGLGYRFSPGLLMKAEYTFNEGTEQNGAKRRHENLVAAEVAVKF